MPRSSRLPLRAVAGIAALSVMGVGTPPSLAGQSLTDRIKQKVVDKANQEADAAIDGTIDKATGAVKCTITNTACIHKAEVAGQPVKITDAKGKPVSSADSAKAIAAAGAAPPDAAVGAGAGASATAPPGATPGASAAPDSKVFVNYDFIPGDRVIFAEDFARDAVGDFPKRAELKSGNLEVAEKGGLRMLRASSTSEVVFPLPEAIPDRFTFEMDYTVNPGWSIEAKFADPEKSDDVAFATFSMTGGGIGGSVDSRSDLPTGADLPMNHVAVMADGKYVKMYINGVRVSNVPSANLGRGKAVHLDLPGSQEEPTVVTNIRLAEGGKKLYEAIAATGRVATHGILFATGSDQIRPESKPTLQQIGDMLKQHADLKLIIEGHTDNVGSAASNQGLSERRANAVKQYVLTSYGIDAARLTTKGLGGTKPVASNDTPEGRQDNRRVELVKQ
jgi:OmpA-OmpF porin, OOP family